MPAPCLLYYVTDRTQFPGSEPERRAHLLQKIKEAVLAGVDYIQLREKDLSTRDLEALAREAVAIVRSNSHSSAKQSTRILINSRTDVALATDADGVHLRSDDIAPSDVRKIWTSTPTVSSGRPRPLPLIAVSCHDVEEVKSAAQSGADFAAFAPVFEKKGSPGTRRTGLEALRQACQYKIPVFALGGVTLNNAAACLDAGAAGIAAIRLFQQNEIGGIVERLRPSTSE